MKPKKARSRVGAASLEFVAGYIAGCAGVICGHPFDTMFVCHHFFPDVSDRFPHRKVRMQTVAGDVSPRDVFVETIRRERFLGLFKGLLSPVLTHGVNNSLLFGIYQLLEPVRLKYGRDTFVPVDGQSYSMFKDLASIFLTGSVAGFGLLQSTVPFDLVKIQLQTNLTKYGEANPVGKGGFLDCLFHVVRTGGLVGRRSLFHGYMITMARELPFNGIYFLTYEMLKRYSGKDAVWKTLLAGGIAGCIPWATTYPVDYFKSIVQNDFQMTTRQAIREMRAAGTLKWGEVFRGLSPCLYRSFLTHSVTFATWELIRRLMKLDQRGGH